MKKILALLLAGCMALHCVPAARRQSLPTKPAAAATPMRLPTVIPW